MNPAGRNDPCPCGSGLKYKKCCLEKRGDSISDSDDTQGLLARAYKNMADENWDEAIALFKDVLETKPEKHTVLEAIGASYDGMENYLLAAEYYEKALTCCPGSKRFELNYRLGVSRACGERLKKASEAFRECLSLHEGLPEKQAILQILEKLELIQEGKGKTNIFYIQTQLQRAFTEMEDERYESAAYRLEKIAPMDPENSAIFYNLGVVYTFLRKEDEAIENFQKCVDLDPEYVQAYYNLGQISLIKKRDFSKALHFFDRAAAVRPDYVGAHHQRGIAYELLGYVQKAIECWEKTLELDPDNKQAKGNIERVRSALEKEPSSENN